MAPRRVVIMGAAGRDFHDFNVVYRDDPTVDVVAFTATQIPGIAGRSYPALLAGPRYPHGIPIVPEDELDRIVREQDVDLVVFAYSDVSHETVMHAASRTLAAGADFTLLGPNRTMLASVKPVVAVVASRTGAGKSQTTRYVAGLLEAAGVRAVVVRHPMPYGDLARQRLQRFATYADLDVHETTIEEREEYEPHLDAGRIVYAGVDYEAILRAAEAEADVILWDGGNNDLAFYRPDLTITVVDPLRPGDETRFHPGETNVRLADIVVVNKVDSAAADAVATVRRNVERLNPRARIVDARSEVSVTDRIDGRRVVVVEDGPTLTHGGMRFGAGTIAARRHHAVVVDPRPFAVGSIASTLARYPDLDALVPAMGYDREQVADLAATLDATPADAILTASPIDLARLTPLAKPIVRARYELAPCDDGVLRRAVDRIVRAARASHAAQPTRAIRTRAADSVLATPR